MQGYDSQGNPILANVQIDSSGKVASQNVDNRIYLIEGRNLIIASKEDIEEITSESDWGTVNGMTFFGLYGLNHETEGITLAIYDPNYSGGIKEGFFVAGSYIEARHKANHNIKTDTNYGFYTNIANYENGIATSVVQQYVNTVEFGIYHDWIVGEETQKYELTLTASRYASEVLGSLDMALSYEPGMTYSISRVSLYALSLGVNLLEAEEIPTIANPAENANNTFGLRMQTADTGWLQSASSDILTADDGSCTNPGLVFASDNSESYPTFNFRLYNSRNITKGQELGTVNLELIGKSRYGQDSESGRVVSIIISINIRTILEEDAFMYKPSFTDKTEEQLYYTNDSRVDLSYILYKISAESIYSDGDYRVLSSNYQLPANTKLTLIDEVTDKVFYYEIPENAPYDYTEGDESAGTKRYIYKLNKFTEMGCTDGKVKYVDSGEYFKAPKEGSDDDGYALEQYSLSVDFRNSNITSDKIGFQIYLELRDSSDIVKYDQLDRLIKFDLLTNKNVVMQEKITNEESEYELLDDVEIGFVFNADYKEQTITTREIVDEVETDVVHNIIDSKYYSQKAGIAIEMIKDGEPIQRMNYPDFIGMKLQVGEDNIYYPDSNGVIRFNVADGFANIEEDMILSFSQNGLDTGKYIMKVYFFSSDDGKYYTTATKPVLEKEFYISAISKNLGFKVDVEDTNRIFSSSTTTDLDKNESLDMTLKFNEMIPNANIRLSLYKRDATYTQDEEGEYTVYNKNVSYSLKDLGQYFDESLEKPEQQGLKSANSYEYIVQTNLNSLEKSREDNLYHVDFLEKIKEGISTGEYKLQFTIYSKDTPIETIEKTFVVIE